MYMIGIFDSGSGGLSVAHALRALAPRVDVVYYGDIKNMPYGTKSQAELIDLTVQALNFLKEKGCDHIISACNSVSAQVIIPHFSFRKDTLIEMVGPTVESLSLFQTKKIAIVATPATVQSGMYTQALKTHTITPHMIANSNLAQAIEFENIPHITTEIILIVAECIKHHIQILSLSCTHYPLVKHMFLEEIKNQQADITLVDPSEAVAQTALVQFPTDGTGQCNAYISEHSKPFTDRLLALFPDAHLNSAA